MRSLQPLIVARPDRYAPSQADVAIFKAISTPPFINVARWYNHIKSYEAEFGTLSGSSTAGEAFLSSGASASTSAPAAATATAAAADDDDDEVDLFGSDEEDDAEAERVKAERVAAYNAKKANKPKTIAKVRALRPHDLYPPAPPAAPIPLFCYGGSDLMPFRCSRW